jgi:hypothetical protein
MSEYTGHVARGIKIHAAAPIGVDDVKRQQADERSANQTHLKEPDNDEASFLKMPFYNSFQITVGLVRSTISFLLTLRV